MHHNTLRHRERAAVAVVASLPVLPHCAAAVSLKKDAKPVLIVPV